MTSQKNEKEQNKNLYLEDKLSASNDSQSDNEIFKDEEVLSISGYSSHDEINDEDTGRIYKKLEN